MLSFAIFVLEAICHIWSLSLDMLLFRMRTSSGKSFMCRNLVELFVEFKFDQCMLNLPILYLLLCGQIKFGKITVQHTWCLVDAVKF